MAATTINAIAQHPGARAKTGTRSANDNAAREDRRMVLVIVIVTRTRDGQWQGLLALTRNEEADRVDLTTVWIRGIGSALDVVRLKVVVDERHTLAHSDDQLLRIAAGGAMRMIGGSGGGGVGPVLGPGGALPDEPSLPQVDASDASAIVTNKERIFRRR